MIEDVTNSNFSDMQKYVKKPVSILARQMKKQFKVMTLEGVMTGQAGDYLVIGVEGERYPVKERIFHKTYGCFEGDCSIDWKMIDYATNLFKSAFIRNPSSFQGTRHVEKALAVMGNDNELARYIEISNMNDIAGVPPVVHFAVQSDPVNEVGIDGCQARDMIEYILWLIVSLDNTFPCEENKHTIVNLSRAIEWQDRRTADREKRCVEGKNEA